MSSKRKTTQTKTPIQDHAPEYRQAVEHHRNGRLEQALDCYEKALRQIPGDARIHHDLGVLYYQTGNNEGAAACFDAAVRYAPEMAEAHFNKGNVLIRLQRPAEAMAAYGRAIRLRPDFADAHFNLANLCKSLDDPRKAEKHYNEALRHHPGHVEAHNNLGNLKLQCGDLDAAIALFNRALDFEPGRTETLYNLALAYKRKGRAGDSVACLKKVLRASPGHSQSKALLVTLLQQLCAWEDLAEAVASLTEDTRDKLARGHLPAESPFLSFTLAGDPERCLRVARAWSQALEDNYPRQLASIDRHVKKDDRGIITIGYLSEQFRDAATAHLTAGLFACHDRRRVRVIAYSLCPADESYYQKRIKQGVDCFVELHGLSAEHAAKRIRADGVDVLVDLIGWMHGHRIAITAQRPAPIQVNYLGFPGTMGARFVDYIIADNIVIPPGHERFYAEKIVRLPHCYQATDPNPAVDDRKISRQSCGLPPSGFVFCSFCTDYKIEKEAFQTWMTILRSVPNSVLWLLIRTEDARRRLCSAADKAGVDETRLIFAVPQPKERHLSRLRCADLALDTFTVNGHTTTTDALWAGVPVVTVPGGHFASRVAASILSAVGLDGLVCRTREDYQNLSILLAKNPEKLHAWKRRLAENRKNHPLFDIQRFTRGLETAFATMWDLYIRGQAPKGFRIYESS